MGDKEEHQGPQSANSEMLLLWASGVWPKVSPYGWVLLYMLDGLVLFAGCFRQGSVASWASGTGAIGLLDASVGFDLFCHPCPSGLGFQAATLSWAPFSFPETVLYRP